MSKNIVLVGLSGSGKTSVGNLLTAKLRGFSFADTDAMIVKSENRSINEIFTTDGEAKFRDLETNAVQKVSQSENQIISTGGGIVLRKENIIMLKQKGIMFYLKTSPEILIERLKDDDSRPLLKTIDIKNKLYSMLEVRAKLYEKSDYTIITDDLTLEQTADEIVRIYNERS